MSKRSIPSDLDPRKDWHALMKSAGDSDAMFDDQMLVELRKGVTVVIGRPTRPTMILTGVLESLGIMALIGGCISLLANTVPGVVLLVIGVGLIGGGAYAFFMRPVIRVSPDGAELIVARGPGKTFHLAANELIPRLSAGGELGVCLKLFNITLRQSIVLVRGERDYAEEVFHAIDGMLGTDKIDSTFIEVKLAGLADEWVDPEPSAPIDETQGDRNSGPSKQTCRPMRAAGFIFFGARLLFPEKQIASIQLPMLRRIGPPAAICVGLWLVVTLLLLVVGGMLGLSTSTATIVGELCFTVLVLCVGAFFWYYGSAITIDRSKRTISGPRRHKCGFTGESISTDEVTMVQSCCDAPPGSDPQTDAFRYELNLVMREAPRRINLLTDSDAARVGKAAEELAEFLSVSHWDCSLRDE